MKQKSITTLTLLAILLIITITSTIATRHIHPQKHVIGKTKKGAVSDGVRNNNGTNNNNGSAGVRNNNGTNNNNNGSGGVRNNNGTNNNNNRGGGGPLGGIFGPGGVFNIPGLGGGVFGGGFGGPKGGIGKSGVVMSSVVCKEKGPCFGKKLICPAKCYKSYSSAGKGYGFGGATGGCTMDCKKKCVAYC